MSPPLQGVYARGCRPGNHDPQLYVGKFIEGGSAAPESVAAHTNFSLLGTVLPLAPPPCENDRSHRGPRRVAERPGERQHPACLEPDLCAAARVRRRGVSRLAEAARDGDGTRGAGERTARAPWKATGRPWSVADRRRCPRLGPGRVAEER